MDKRVAAKLASEGAPARAGLPLHEAAGAGHTGIVEDLLRGRSDPRACDADAETALLRAARRGFVGAVEVVPSASVPLRSTCLCCADDTRTLDHVPRHRASVVYCLYAAARFCLLLSMVSHVFCYSTYGLWHLVPVVVRKGVAGTEHGRRGRGCGQSMPLIASSVSGHEAVVSQHCVGALM